MKTCCHCKKELSLDNFTVKVRATGQLQPYCKSCKSVYNKTWYEKNKAKHKADAKRNTQKYRDRYKALVFELKSVPCADCGGKFHPVAMDFDHVLDNKLWNISRMTAHSFDKLIDEIKKCEVVCSNCHRVRTHNRRLRIGATS